MHQQSTKIRPRLEVDYTSKPLSGWGGLEAVVRFWDGCGLRDVLRQGLPDGRTSNNQVDVVDMAVQLIVSVLTGGSRFEHVERVRADEVIRQIVGAQRFASASPITSYFGNFTAQQSERLQELLCRVSLEYACASAGTSDVVDLDSTVMTRYGTQEGSSRGYNPSRRGARSHRPLLAMFSKSKLIPHVWLRDGAANDHRGSEEFFRELLARLPDGFKISAVRADAGFFGREFLSFLEAQQTPYAIRMKMSRPFEKWCAGLKGWKQIGVGLCITDEIYESPKAKVPRRVVVTRKITKVEGDGFFPIIDYEYAAIVTSLQMPALDVWRFYNDRGDCENRIKELKYDFNADGYCLRNFHGTEAVLRLICFAYNLISLFKTFVLRDAKITLGRIRTTIFVIGASIGSSGRRRILRLGLIGRWKLEFTNLLERCSESISTTAQLNKRLKLIDFEPPSPWRLRRKSPLATLAAY